MKLFKIQGNWGGNVRPTITSIKLKSTGQYDYENVEYEVFNKDGINKDNPPVLNDLNHRWSFIVTSEGIPESTYEQYHGTLTTDGMRVIVTYTGESGVANTCSAKLTVENAIDTRVEYENGIHGSKYLKYIYSQHGVPLMLVAYRPSDTIRPGSRLLAYVVLDSYDETTDTYSQVGINKSEVDLDITFEPSAPNAIHQYIPIPDTATRASIYTLSYNINELDVLRDVIPADNSEVMAKVKTWVHSDVKYLEQVSESGAYGTPIVDPYRMGSTLDNWNTFAAMANFTGPSFVHSGNLDDVDIYDPEVWDSATLLKVFSGPYCVAAIKDDLSVITMGYNNGGIRSSIKNNPFPAGLKKIAIGYYHAVGLLSNGTIVNRSDFFSTTWQNDSNSWTDIVDVIAGDDWTVGVKADGSLVSVATTGNSPIVAGQFTNVIAKKIYLIDNNYFAIIDDVGKVYISGEPGGRKVIDDMRTAVADWPGMMYEIVCNRQYLVAFGSHPAQSEKIRCTDANLNGIINGWYDLSAAMIYGNGLIAIQTNGQILSTSSSSRSVKKPANDPSSWAADPLPKLN